MSEAPKKHVLRLVMDDDSELEIVIRPVHRVLARDKWGAEADAEKLTYYAAYRAVNPSEPFEVWLDRIVAVSEELIPFGSMTNSETSPG
jgi:hypothetical protein